MSNHICVNLFVAKGSNVNFELRWDRCCDRLVVPLLVLNLDSGWNIGHRRGCFMFALLLPDRSQISLRLNLWVFFERHHAQLFAARVIIHGHCFAEGLLLIHLSHYLI